MITSAKYQKYEIVGENSYRIIVRLTDDVAGISDHGFNVTGTTLVELRDSLTRQIVDLNFRGQAKNVLDGLAVNTNIPVVLPPDPAPTAFELWLIDVKKWQTVKTLLINNLIVDENAAEIVTIKQKAIDGYKASYLNNL